MSLGQGVNPFVIDKSKTGGENTFQVCPLNTFRIQLHSRILSELYLLVRNYKLPLQVESDISMLDHNGIPTSRLVRVKRQC